MKFYKSFQTSSKQLFFPFFVIGAPSSIFVEHNFEQLIKNAFGLEIYQTLVETDQVFKKVSRDYKFSDFYSHSLLLESFIKDFCVESQKNLVYFQFFYFIEQIEKNFEFDLSSNDYFDFSDLKASLVNFCNFIYFIGFGKNLLINYSDFRKFLEFGFTNIKNLQISANCIFIFNFIFNFMSKIFNTIIILLIFCDFVKTY